MEQASTTRQLFARPIPRRLLVASPFVAVAVVLVALAIFFMELLSAARAYVGGESLYTKAQKQAVQSLVRFAQLRDGAEWFAYQQAIAVPLGDRAAREELEKPSPDFESDAPRLHRRQPAPRRHRRHDPVVSLVPRRPSDRPGDRHLGRGRRPGR
jgi:hypothetical protein